MHASLLRSAQSRLVRALLLGLVALLPPLGLLVPTASAQTAVALGVGPFAKGAVVSLKGTPHLWYADEWGTLHWAADTRALAGHGATSITRTEVTAEQLRTLPAGAPWLSAGLVKVGSDIYLPKWDSGDAAPTLLHVLSFADLHAIGLSDNAVSAALLDQATWERTYGISAAQLKKADLPSVPIAALPPGMWTPFTSEAGGFRIYAPSFTPVPVPANMAGGLTANIPPESIANLPTDVHLFVFGALLDGPSTLYVAGSATLPEEIREQIADVGPDLMFEAIRSQVLKQSSVELLSYRSIMQGTYSGRELSLRPVLPDPSTIPNAGEYLPPDFPMPDVVVTLRVLLGGPKIYLLGAINAPATAPPADVTKFMDSFTLLPTQS